VDATVDDLEPEGFVNELGMKVVQPGVGSHFAATLAASPLFGFGQQTGSDSLVLPGGGYIPTFHESDGM
jgi:hypothetical protein